MQAVTSWPDSRVTLGTTRTQGDLARLLYEPTPLSPAPLLGSRGSRVSQLWPPSRGNRLARFGLIDPTAGRRTIDRNRASRWIPWHLRGSQCRAGRATRCRTLSPALLRLLAPTNVMHFDPLAKTPVTNTGRRDLLPRLWCAPPRPPRINPDETAHAGRQQDRRERDAEASHTVAAVVRRGHRRGG